MSRIFFIAFLKNVVSLGAASAASSLPSRMNKTIPSKTIKQDAKQIKSKSPTGKIEEEKILVIVESPAKAKTIQSILNKNFDSSKKTFVVDFCAGHIRELASNAKQISNYSPENDIVESHLKLKVSSLGVDVFNDFKPFYVISPGKREIVTRLKKAANSVDRILLATDEDREGEAISWHLLDVIKPTVPVQRAVFHEITQSAIMKSFDEPRDLDMNLVQAQETRQILDKLTGYTLSPMLWNNVAYGLSAGRVQSCGLHLIVERERRRWAFVESKYYSITAALESIQGAKDEQKPIVFPANLVQLNGKKVADEKDFDNASGDVKKSSKDKVIVLDKARALSVMEWLNGTSSKNAPNFYVSEKTERKLTRSPPAPFITSTLQQEASKKLGFSPARTMALAQTLYQEGFITYMRTDSPILSVLAQDACKKMVKQIFGDDFLAGNATNKTSKAKVSPKNAQEAHEAIRPAEFNGLFKSSESIGLTGDSKRLYDLIYRRTLSSVMKPSQSLTTTISVAVTNASIAKRNSVEETDTLFRYSETELQFPGYLACMDERAVAKSKAKGRFTSLKVGQELRVSAHAPEGAAPQPLSDSSDADSDQDSSNDDLDNDSDSSPLSSLFPGINSVEHVTRAPSRFSEASFIKELEILGVGRPSTYSSILQILKDRGYIIVERQTIIPTGKGLIVSKFMEKYFSEFVDEKFTASMEKSLDFIAHGEKDKLSFLKSFYFESEAQKKKSDSQQIGLLSRVTSILSSGMINPKESRSFQLPYLQDKGILLLTKAGLCFEYSGSSSNEGDDDDDDDDDDSAKESAKNFLIKKLPDLLEQDIRLITPDAIDEIRGNDTALPSEGKALVSSELDANTTLTLKSGVYGKYIVQQKTRGKRTYKSNHPVPSWVSEDLSPKDALDLVSLPKVIGEFPVTNSSMKLSVFNGKFIVSAEKFGFQAEVTDHLLPKDFTPEYCIELLRSATAPSNSMMDKLGTWEDMEIELRSGRFGPYLKCGNIIAGLGKRDPASITLEVAIELLQKKRDNPRSKSSQPKAKGTPSLISKASNQNGSDDSPNVEQKKESKTKAKPKKVGATKLKSKSTTGSDNEELKDEPKVSSRVKKDSAKGKPKPKTMAKTTAKSKLHNKDS